MHDVFSSWDRRAIIYYLIHHEDPAPVEDVLRHLVAWSRGDVEPGPEDGTVADAVRADFLCQHVRRMDEFGIVTFDPEEDRISLADGVEVMVSPPWASGAEGSESEVVDEVAGDATADSSDAGPPRP